MDKSFIKPISGLMLAIVFALTLTACGGGGGGASSDSGTGSGGTTQSTNGGGGSGTPTPVASVRLSQPTITITAGSIVANECKPFTLNISNNSATAETLKSFTVNVSGTGASVVNNIRTTTRGAVTNVAVANNIATITRDFSVNANSSVAVALEYCIKDTFTGISSGADIKFAISAITTSESGVNSPVGGIFAAAVTMDNIDISTAATKITATQWQGYMSQASQQLSAGTNQCVSGSVYNVDNITASGPSGAKWKSITLKNPYGSAITYDNTSWDIDYGTPPRSTANIPQANVSWSGDYVTLTVPSEVVIPTNGTVYKYTIGVRTCNGSATQAFDSDTVTSGLFGLALESKNDLILIDANGQKINLDSLPMKQGGSTVVNW